MQSVNLAEHKTPFCVTKIVDSNEIMLLSSKLNVLHPITQGLITSLD